jgi:site-specific DNA recombinase
VLGHCCDNARDVDRKAAESRVLTGLRERMMTPEIAVDTMRLYTTAQRRSSSELTRREFAEAVIAIAEIVRVIGKAVGIAPGPTG